MREGEPEEECSWGWRVKWSEGGVEGECELLLGGGRVEVSCWG